MAGPRTVIPCFHDSISLHVSLCFPLLASLSRGLFLHPASLAPSVERELSFPTIRAKVPWLPPIAPVQVTCLPLSVRVAERCSDWPGQGHVLTFN